MLLVQKDYEIKGFSPFYVRPIPLFAYGYFSLDEDNFKRLTKSYNVLELVCDTRNVYRVNLKKIWEKSYSDQMSFPKFKFLIYSKDKEFEFNKHYKMDSATAIDVFMSEKLQENFYKIITSLKNLIGLSTFRKRFIRRDELVNGIAKEVGISLYQSETIINVVISAMEVYRKELAGKLNINIFRVRTLRDNQVSYKFNAAAGQFFKWLEKEYLWLQNALIKANGDRIFVVNRQKNTRNREVATSLGILEAFGLLRFKTLGGSNSQLYIYVNETKTMRMVNEKPHIYKNKLLERINNRHNESVKMLTQLFQNNLSSDAIWERLENYFLSIKQ
jgi:ATP-dependent DNA helicase RecQ